MAKKTAKKATKKVAKKATKKAPAKKAAAKKVTKKATAKKASAKKAVTKKAAAPKPQSLTAKGKTLSDSATAKPKAAAKPRKRVSAKAQAQIDLMSKKWMSLQKKSVSKGIEAEPYNMRKQYEAKTPIIHKVLGWGFIMNNVNDRLEVLFEDGIKHLISNYQ